MIGQNLQPLTEYHSTATARKTFKTLKLLQSNNLDNKINSQAAHMLLAKVVSSIKSSLLKKYFPIYQIHFSNLTQS